VAPVAVAARLAGGGRWRLERIAVEPAPNVVLVELLDQSIPANACRMTFFSSSDSRAGMTAE
jgi:hypothetical protein